MTPVCPKLGVFQLKNFEKLVNRLIGKLFIFSFLHTFPFSKNYFSVCSFIKLCVNRLIAALFMFLPLFAKINKKTNFSQKPFFYCIFIKPVV